MVILSLLSIDGSQKYIRAKALFVPLVSSQAT